MAKRTPANEVYRKVLVRMWRSGSFTRLSPIKPSGQGLFLFLLTCPDSTALPGAIVSGRAGMAEALRWPVREFERCFAEVEREGMARADWDARLVWLPNAMAINPPANPNVVQSWGERFALLPDCKLKETILAEIRTFAQGLGEGFAEGFRKGFGEGLQEGLEEAGGEQGVQPGSRKQEAGTGVEEKTSGAAAATPGVSDLKLTPPPAGRQPIPKPGRKPNPDVKRLLDAAVAACQEYRHFKLVIRGAPEAAAMAALLVGRGYEEAVKLVREFYRDPPDWNRDQGTLSPLHIPGAANKILARLSGSNGKRAPDGTPAGEDPTRIQDTVEVDEHGVRRRVRIFTDRATGRETGRRWGAPMEAAHG